MAVLSKENYIAIAAILKESETKFQIIKKLAEYFEFNNPRFDAGRFFEAVGRVSPFREAMGRAVGLNEELEDLALGQKKESYWIMAKFPRGLWNLAETERDRDEALRTGKKIAELNPGKEIFVLRVVERFLETGLERVP